MKKLMLLGISVAILLQPVASAQSAPQFMTIDAVRVSAGNITVIGVAQGQSAQSQQSIQFVYGTETAKAAALEACHRQLLLALSRPGQYVLVLPTAGWCTVALATP